MAPGCTRKTEAASSMAGMEMGLSLAGIIVNRVSKRKSEPAEWIEKPAKATPKKTSFYQLEEDADRMRAAYLNTQLNTRYRSLSEFINAAIDEKVSALEKAGIQTSNLRPYFQEP